MAFVDVTDPAYKPGGSSSFVDVTDPNYKPTSRSALGEIGTAFERGALVGLPQMVGQALQYTSSKGRGVYDFGKSIADSAAARGERPGLTLQPEEHGAVVNALASGAEMVPSILAPVALSAGALAALPAMPAIAGTALIAGATALPFAAQAGQATLEKGEKAGLPEDAAHTAARVNAGLVFGTQAALGMVGGQLFGRGARLFGEIVRKDGAELAAQTLAELTGKGGYLKPFLKQLPVSTAEATAIGAAQTGGSAAVERAYGVDTVDPWHAAAESVPAMLGLSAIMAPMGLAGRAVRANALAKRAEALGNKDTAPQIRDQLATQYFTELNKVDPAAAKEFAKNADLAIKNGMPLEVDVGLFQEGAVKPPASPQRTLALPAPYDFVAGPGGVGRDAGAVRAAAPGESGPQQLLPAPEALTALPRSKLPTEATAEMGPSAADFFAAKRDRDRAAEENRKALVDTHSHVVQELRAAGIEPTGSMSFPAFRDAMAIEAKKAGLNPTDFTPSDYAGMWEKHQQDVMNENFSKAQKYAFTLAEGSPVKGASGELPRSALAVALEDALKHKQVEDAYRQHESEQATMKEQQLTAVQNIAKGEQLADAAERGMVPPSAKTIPSKSETIVQELRAVKPADQAMPPKLIKEVTTALSKLKSFEAQMEALRAMRDEKKPESASYELLDKLHARLNPDYVPPAIEAKATATAEPAAKAGGRPKGTTDDRHTIGPPNEVGELLPYTRTLSQAREGAGGIFGEKQWWQDLAWAVRNPESKIGKELLGNGKLTDEQVGLALARDERYQRADALLEEMRVKREEALRAQILAEAQPEKAKEILRTKDLVNIFGGVESDYTFEKKSKTAGDEQGVRNLFEFGRARKAMDVLGDLQKIATDPAHKRLIADLSRLKLPTSISMADRVLREGRTAGLYNEIADHVLIGRGGATTSTVLHEIVHAATLPKIDEGMALLGNLWNGKIKDRDLSPDQRRLADAAQSLTDIFLDAMDREGAEQHYGLTNPKEFVAEALSNPKFQDFLRRGGEQTLWQRFVDFVKKVLGLKTSDTLLDRALTTSKEFLADKESTRPLRTAEELPSLERFMEGPTSAAKQTDTILEQAAKLGDVALSIKTGFTKLHLYTTTRNHIQQLFKDVLPEPFRDAPIELGNAKDKTQAIVEARQREALEISRAMSAVEDQHTGLGSKLYRLMGESTRFGISPDLPIEKQAWEGKKATPEKIRKYNELRTIYQANPELQKAYKAANEHNKTNYDQIYATLMRNLAHYSDMPPELWKPIDVVKGRSNEVLALEKWLLEKGNDEQRLAVRGALSQYREKQQGPYFHLGRNGSYFTRFDIKNTPAARAAYEKEFGISSMATERVIGPDDLHVFSRFESVGEWKAVTEKLNRLRTNGHLDPEMQAGQLEQMIGQLDSSSPAFIRGLLRNIEADTRLDPEEKRNAQDVLRRLSIEMLPETSASKAFAQRKGVAGYDVDMNRSFVKRSAATAYFIAHNSIRPEIETAMLRIKQGVQEMQDAASPHYNNDRGLVGAALYAELKKREANELLPIKTPIMDNVSALSHSFYLAANPAFLIMKTTQPWQLTLPLLGARHGFVRSFGAMTKATATSLGIIRDTIGEGWQRGQWKGILDPNIVIDKSKATASEKQFLKALIDAGGATFTQAHDMGYIAAGESQGISTAVKAANASMHYSEALDRMTAGLTAFNLEMKRSGGNVDVSTQYGIQTVKNTLFDYNTHNRGRMFSKQGIAGAATPMLTQFMQYQVQTLELMGRLSLDAFGKLDPTMTPVERAAAITEKTEARKALAGIMATTMVFAGTLGLPAVSIVTAAYNNIFGTKDNPADALSDYRNFLADTFGKEAGEIIAHGGLRAGGSDLGTRLGYQDIVPFSRFLSDRRKLQDRFDAGAMNMLGPAVGAASGFMYGAQSMMQGRYMKGLEQMLPSGLKSVVKAVELEQHGLTDLRGNKIPVGINSWDIFNQLLGSTPSKVAEQKEAQRAANTTSMLLKQRAMDLKENFAVASERSDATAMKNLVTEIVGFNKENPDFAIRDLTGILKQRASDRIIAEQTNVTGKARQLPRLQADARFANIRGMP